MNAGTNAPQEAEPYFGYKWQHRKTGHIYNIICFGIEEATLTPIVVYGEDKFGAVWTRPCAEFFDGRFKAMPINSVTSGTAA